MGFIRLIREIGFGVDLVKGSDVVAIRRAIQDIIHRVSIPFFKEAGISTEESILNVYVFTPNPNSVNSSVIINELPVMFKDVKVIINGGGGKLGDTIMSIIVIEVLIPTPQAVPRPRSL